MHALRNDSYDALDVCINSVRLVILLLITPNPVKSFEARCLCYADGPSFMLINANRKYSSTCMYTYVQQQAYKLQFRQLASCISIVINTAGEINRPCRQVIATLWQPILGCYIDKRADIACEAFTKATSDLV